MQQQFDELIRNVRKKSLRSEVTRVALNNGSTLIKITRVDMGPGWNRSESDVLFVAPPAYPAGAPDCFWVEPSQLRLADGSTPKNTNDSNAIPCDNQAGRQTTWFSWHVQAWNPSTDTLSDYYQLILDRLRPAR